MRKVIRKLGRIKLVLIITVITIILAELLAFLIPYTLGFPYVSPDTPVITALVTLIVTPIASWYLLGVLISLDKLEHKMNLLATYDSMTTLLNRQPFLEKSELLHNKVTLQNSAYCLFFIDIDNFKKINDTYGHAVGDKILMKYGEIVKKIFKKEDDILGRMGGEEFGIVSHVRIDKGRELAETLCKEIANFKLYYHNEPIQFTVSIGGYENKDKPNISLKNVFRNADEALYRSKSQGKNRVTFFSD